MHQLGAAEPTPAQKEDLAFRNLRVACLLGAVQSAIGAAILAARTTLPLSACTAIGLSGAVYWLYVLRHFKRVRRAQRAREANPLESESWFAEQRLRLPGTLRPRIALVLGAELALVVVMIGAHAWSRSSCVHAGISTPAGREGKCVRYMNLFGSKTTYRVINAGHVLHMPRYDVQLLATDIAPTRVSDPQINPSAYPGGVGTLVSMELTVINSSDQPLAFNPTGHDVDLLIDEPGSSQSELSFFDLPNASGEPGRSIATAGPITPRSAMTGWVSFVAPSWVGQVLHIRSADLELRQPQGYVGQIRLWKWANAQGRTALGLDTTG